MHRYSQGEDFSDVHRHSGFFVGTRYFFDLLDNGTVQRGFPSHLFLLLPEWWLPLCSSGHNPHLEASSLTMIMFFIDSSYKVTGFGTEQTLDARAPRCFYPDLSQE